MMHFKIRLHFLHIMVRYLHIGTVGVCTPRIVRLEPQMPEILLRFLSNITLSILFAAAIVAHFYK
jgi:hypothetical protein